MPRNDIESLKDPQESADKVCSMLPDTVSDSLVGKAISRLDKFSAYDQNIYSSRHPDSIDNPNPAEHLIRLGCFQGRAEAFSKAQIASVLTNLCSEGENSKIAASRDSACENQEDAIRKLVSELPAIGVFVRVKGSRLLTEFAEELVDCLKEFGVNCALLSDHTPLKDCPPIPIFIAPHEFFYRGKGPEWIRDDILQKAIIFNFEQVQTEWFLRGLPFALMSKGVLDLSFQTSALLNQCGVPSIQMTIPARPGAPNLSEKDLEHPFIASLPIAAKKSGDLLAPLEKRPIDVAFFGTSSLRRERFFANNAAFLAHYQTFLYYRRMKSRGSVKDTALEQSLNKLSRHVATHSKIVLNIHRDENKYFEWHRIVRLSMDSNAAVVSEPCLPDPHFAAGTHYIEATSAEIPQVLRWLIETPDGKAEAERIRSNAFALLAREYSSGSSVLHLLRFLSELSKQPERVNSVRWNG